MRRSAAFSLLTGAVLLVQPQQNLCAQSFPSYTPLTQAGAPVSTAVSERPFVELLAPTWNSDDVRPHSEYLLHPKRDEAGRRFGRISNFVPLWDRGRVPKDPPGMVSLFGTETDRLDGSGTILTHPLADPTTPLKESDEPLPPLDEELWLHGGSYLYMPEGDRLNWPSPESDEHYQILRLPESWEKPRPLTAFQEFLGSDPIKPRPGLKWFGDDGFQWEPRFVAYGSYELFGIALEDGGGRRNGIGHQLLIDLDLRLTGTERFHVQFRPLGRKNSGGSFYQFNDPSGYNDNSTLIPDRYWFEGELFSMFGGLSDEEFTPRDYHIVAGKFPFSLHNSLLIDDDILGFAINKNTILVSPLSNLNVQFFAGLDDVDNAQSPSPDLYGLNLTADYRNALYEATYAFVRDGNDSLRDAHYAAGSATQFFGPLTLAGRALFKWQSAGESGQLYVLESNYTRVFEGWFDEFTGIDHAVFYANAFHATDNWTSISGGNFNRLRSTFEINPLVALAQGTRAAETTGTSLGAQLFRHHEDQSILPEVVFEDRDGTSVWGVGLRMFCKVSSRMFVETRGIKAWSSREQFRREGVFLSSTIIF